MIRARHTVAAVLLAAAPAAASACDLDGFMGHRFSSLQSQYDPSANYSTDETRTDSSSSDAAARDQYAAADAARAAEAQPASSDPSKPQRDYR